MKLLCRYSGLAYQTDYFQEDKMVDCHPIFRASQRDLLAKARKWGEGKYEENEEKLLFLALLNSTGAVDFKTPASPSRSIVLQNMEALFKLVAWHEHVNPGTFKLPTFRVSDYDYTLSNVHVWITSWYECRAEWMRTGDRKALQDSLETREFIISKMINSGKSAEEMAPRLASWAMIAAKVPLWTRDYWTALFKLKGDAIYDQEHLDGLESCLQWMQDKLFAVGSYGAGAGTTYAILTLQLLQSLKERCEGGQLADLLGNEARSFSFSSINEEGEESEEKGVEFQGRELVTWKLMAAEAPTEEPKREDYPSLGAFIRARANFSAVRILRETAEAKKGKSRVNTLSSLSSLSALSNTVKIEEL